LWEILATLNKVKRGYIEKPPLSDVGQAGFRCKRESFLKDCFLGGKLVSLRRIPD